GLRRLLPALGRAADRRRDDPTHPAPGSVARARPDPDRARCLGRGGARDGAREPAGSGGSRPGRGQAARAPARRLPTTLPAQRPHVGVPPVGAAARPGAAARDRARLGDDPLGRDARRRDALRQGRGETRGVREVTRLWLAAALVTLAATAGAESPQAGAESLVRWEWRIRWLQDVPELTLLGRNQTDREVAYAFRFEPGTAPCALSGSLGGRIPPRGWSHRSEPLLAVRGKLPCEIPLRVSARLDSG